MARLYGVFEARKARAGGYVGNKYTVPDPCFPDTPFALHLLAT